MKVMWSTSSFSECGFPSDWEIVPNPYQRRLTEDEIFNLLKEHKPDGLIAGNEPLTNKVLKGASNLKVISRCGIGIDNVDLQAAKEYGIIVSNTPQAPVVSVAELALAFILSLSRRLYEIDSSMKKKEWNKAQGYLVSGKTVAVIGCGRIGTHLAHILDAMGCTLLGYDPFMKEHQVCRMCDLETIWREADIISLHVPLKEETRHLLNEEVMGKLKKTCIIVNTSRGGLVDEEALLRAIQRNDIAGVALDVYEDEPYSGRLCELKGNILLTSHIASNTREGRSIMEKEALNNLVEGLKIQKFN